MPSGWHRFTFHSSLFTLHFSLLILLPSPFGEELGGEAFSLVLAP